MEDYECTEKCRSELHGDLICAALTKRDVSDEELCSYLSRVCCCCESVRDSCGRTALHVAASVGRANIVKWLIKRKQININARDKESGYTALHRSIFYGKINVAVALLEAGSNNVYDFDNLSCLDHAMKNNYNLEFPRNSSGEVYICGSNTNYVFGMQQSRLTPEIWDTFHKKYRYESIKQICLDKFHCVMVSNNGHVYSCGHGQGGRLSLGSEVTVLDPLEITFSDNQQILYYHCICASISRDHSIFLTKGDDMNYVWTCGLNTYHILGINPPPQKLLTPKRLRNFEHQIEGVCAARYHSVVWGPNALYSWGLHGGQLGHDKSNQKFIIKPKLVSCMFQMKSTIVEVSTSTGATVVATSIGDIYVLHEYQCRKITSRHKLLNLSVVGGRLDTSLDSTLVPDKNCELKILVLTNDGRMLLWKESDPHLTRCLLSLNREVIVTQAVMNLNEILFISKEGEAFRGTIKNKKKKSSEDGEGPVLRSMFHQFLDKDECHFVKVTKLQKIHRAVLIETDSKGENIAIIQVNPRIALENLSSITPGNFTSQLKALLDYADIDDFVHDVIFVVGIKKFAAHRYIIASCSDILMKMMSNNNTIGIENVHPDIFEELLLWIYTGKCNLSEIGHCPKNLLAFNKRVCKDENLNNRKMTSTSKNITNETNCKNAIRLLQELAKRFEIIELEKRLSKLTIKDDNIQFYKNEQDKFGGAEKKTYDRFQHKNFYDFELISKTGQIVKAHKCILVARVDFFEKLYSNRWNMKIPKAEMTFPYSEIILELFLEYLYTDELICAQTLDLETLISLLILSDQYFVIRLKEICEVTLCHLVSLKNAVQLLALADVYTSTKLKFYVMEFICLNLAAFLESKMLENLSAELLDELTHHYQQTNKMMQSRNITPYSTAPTDEAILDISKLYPISFEFDLNESFITQTKTTTQSAKKRLRSHKIISPENVKSDYDHTPEKTEILNSAIEENENLFTNTKIPSRIKAINDAQAKIKSEEENFSYTKLNTMSLHGSFCDDFPLLNEHVGMGKSPNKHDKIDWHKLPKLSQKQRRRLFSDDNGKEATNSTLSESPKNPWKVIEMVTPTSLEMQTISNIITEEKKQKENFYKMITKPLIYTQIEDKAIEDLHRFYNSIDAIEEVITAQRVYTKTVCAPTWVQKTK